MLAGLGTTATAEMAPSAWLVRADHAAERTNFTGTMSLLQNGEVRRTMRIQQGFDGHNTHQRLITTSGGEDCEILRRGGESAVAFPARRVVIHGYQRPQGLVPKIGAEIGRVEQHYELKAEGREKVAGRDCQLVTAVSRDPYRYSCEFCVDTVSGLPLRVRMVAPDGEKIERFAFTSLDVLDSMQEFAPNSFWMATDTRGFETVSLPYGSRPAPHRWRVGQLPPGFEERLAVARKLPRSPEPVYHIVLADVLSRVSVFITPLAEGREVKNRQFRRKALNGYVTVRDGHRVTVIGGVPAETVRMIGDSLHLDP